MVLFRGPASPISETHEFFPRAPPVSHSRESWPRGNGQLSSADEYRDSIQGFLQDLRDAQHRQGAIANSARDTWADIALVIHMDIVLEGLLDKAPLDPPELRQIASQIRALPLITRIITAHPNVPPVDQRTSVGDLEVLEFKLVEMLDYLPPPGSQVRKEASPTRSPLPVKGRLRRRRRVKTYLNESERRAHTVARVKRELDRLRRGMTGTESAYFALEKKHPRFLTFEIVREHPEFRKRVMNLQEDRARLRLAQELTAAKYGRALTTVQKDWKVSKPSECRRAGVQSPQ